MIKRGSPQEMVTKFYDIYLDYKRIAEWLEETGFADHRRFCYLKTSEAIILSRLIDGDVHADELTKVLAVEKPGISRNVMYLRDRGVVIDIVKWRLRLRGVMSDEEFKRYTARGRNKRVAVRTRFDDGPRL
jgi:hypothetical protein